MTAHGIASAKGYKMSNGAFSIPALAGALAGGVLIGAAASLLLMLNGRVAGISGIVAGLFSRDVEEVRWRALFIIGLLAGGGLFAILKPEALLADVQPSVATTIAAGLLVGVGTRIGGGCTSGHGVCGISRLSSRSIVATLTFVATGMLTVFLVRHVLGGVQ
jgi:uncharacterized membrane protein YedE/YeeE